MSREHADNVYPPKIGSSSLTMQRVVRGFLARKRLRWQRQLELRRELVKAQEQKMRQALPHKDKVLLERGRGGVSAGGCGQVRRAGY